jgi:hypothetical protein
MGRSLPGSAAETTRKPAAFRRGDGQHLAQFGQEELGVGTLGRAGGGPAGDGVLDGKSAAGASRRGRAICAWANGFAPARWTGWFDPLMLAIVARQNSAKRQVLVQIWPMESEGGDLEVAELRRGSTGQAGVGANREPDLRAAVHHQQDYAVPINGRPCAIDQGAHASAQE